MTDFDLSRLLDELNEACSRIASNLLELESHPTVGLLDEVALRGLTAERWRSAREKLAQLFTAHGALRDTLAEATRISGRPWLLTGARLAELRALLAHPSITVSDHTVALSERDLLSRSRVVTRIAPTDLIADMSSDFDAVKAVVLEVAGVWDALVPVLRGYRQRCAELTELAAEFGIDAPVLAECARSLRELSETALFDPLATDHAGVVAVAAQLTRADADLADVEDLRAHWVDRVADLRELLDTVRAAIDECREAARRTNERLALSAPLEPVTLPGEIVAAIARIVSPQRPVAAAAAEVLDIRRDVTGLLDEARRTTDRCRALLAERDELRARLDAYSAKADRLGLLEMPAVMASYERARDCLYSAPTDLDLARDLLVRYQLVLSSGGTP